MKTSACYPFRSAGAKAEYLALYLERAKAWPVASETRLIETSSGQTFVRVSGRLTDPPLVLLHGIRGNSLMWVPNSVRLLSVLAARPEVEAAAPFLHARAARSPPNPAPTMATTGKLLFRLLSPFPPDFRCRLGAGHSSMSRDGGREIRAQI